MGRSFTKAVSALLTAAVLLSVSSCAKNTSSKDARKVSADSPWFDCKTYDIDVGADPDKGIEDFYISVAGADDKYLVVSAYGDYEGTEDQKMANWQAFFFEVITIIDRNTMTVVNTIDVRSTLDTMSDEYVDRLTYTDGIIRVTTNLKETDYDPATAGVLDTRSVINNNMVLPDYYFAGEYLIEALFDFSGDEGGYEITVRSPEGGSVTSDLKEFGTSFTSIEILPLSGTKAMILTDTSKGKRYYELDLISGLISIADSEEYEWMDLDKIEAALIGSDGKLYCRTRTGISGADIDSKTAEELFNYNWCGANRAKLEMCEIADCTGTSMLFAGQTENRGEYYGSQRSFQVVELTRSDKNPNAGKTVLELYAPYIGTDIGTAIEKYNENNKKFFIEVVDRYDEQKYYKVEGDWRNYSATELRIASLNGASALSNDLMGDIIAGNGPDILIGTSDYRQLNNPDYLMDLSPYVKGLKSEDYFTNIIEGSKSNGVLYQLPVSIYINGIYTDAKYAGSSGTGFTFEEYESFVRETLNGKDVIVPNQAFYFAELFNSMDDIFIKDGKADFSCPEFAEIAAYVKDNVRNAGITTEEMYMDSANYAKNAEMQSYLDFYHRKDEMRILDEPTVLGKPSLDGRGPRFTSSSSVAVSAQAVNADACGEFIKLLLSDEIQTEIAMSGHGFVLSRNAFRAGGEAAVSYCSSLDDHRESDKVKFTTDDIDNIERILMSCSSLKSDDPDISIILIEEMPPYFLDQKDLDSVIKIAQDRVQKVLDERG